VVDGDVVRYVIEDGTDWEIGTGTYTASGTTLSRTVLESSNADAALDLSGDAVVFVGAAAEDIPPVLELYAENPGTFTAPSATGTNAVAIGNGAVSSGLGSLAFAGSATGSSSISLGLASSASNSNALAVIRGTASGQNSIAIGQITIASANRSVALGPDTRASGFDSFSVNIQNSTAAFGASGSSSVAIGFSNKASGFGSVAIGGSFNIASGNNSSAVGSSSSEATQQGSRVGGQFSKSVVIGKDVWASGRFSTTGDAQTGTFVLRSDTTDATPEALTTDNSAPGTTDQIILPNNSAYAFHGTIVARQQASAGTACAAWKIEGLIRREGSAGTTVLVNSATTVLDNTPGWGMTLSADTTNGGLKIEVTGAAATNIRFVATIHTSEVTF
jgi:hypothetical protein